MAELQGWRILVSGVSGPIGSALLPALQASGAQITRLARASSRQSSADENRIPWDPAQALSSEAVSGFDAVIHLAGESIVGKWTEEKKKKIRDSRVLGTRHLATALAQTSQRPRVFVSSSATGYYGDRGDELLSEESASGQGFLPEVCREWEAATAAAGAGIRTVQIRTGVVLSPRGGALGEMLTPFKLGVGGRIGSGKQWMSWIHVQDVVGAILHILESESVRGPVNMVGPAPVTNAEFTKTLASAVSRPAIFPIPVLMVKLAFGEMGETVLLGSQRVEPRRLQASGFSFSFQSLRSALENLIPR